MSSASKPTIAFLGATGGCAGWALVTALENGHKCRALVRSPEKLQTQLADKGVSSDLVLENLVIVKGDAKIKDDVKPLLIDNNGRMVDTVVSSVGAAPSFVWALRPFVMSDPNICEVAMETLLAAITELTQTGQHSAPDVVTVSTTGLSDGPRDVPLLLVPLYHWLLAEPHVDKDKMETALRKASKEIKSATIVKASLLTDGESYIDQVRAGVRAKPAVGYTISRKDVGIWLYRNLLNGQESRWRGETVTITY